METSFQLAEVPWGGWRSPAFVALWTLWTVVDRCGPLWTVVDRCGPLWTVVDRCGPLWTVVDRCGPLWTVVWTSVKGTVVLCSDPAGGRIC